MKVHREVIALTASSGSASDATIEFVGALLNLVHCSPTTSTTTYDITITDNQSNIVFEHYAVEGRMNAECNIPLKGSYTVALANTSADEAFSIELMAREA